MTARDVSHFLADDSDLPDDERQLLSRARALIPRLAERAPAATAARSVPPETIAEYHDAGILKILQRRRFGGRQGRFSLFSQIVEELTYGCASSAWVYAVLGEHQWIIASYPEQAQIDVWGDDPDAVAASSLAPRAAATRLAAQRALQLFERLRPCAMGDPRRLSRQDRRPSHDRLSARAACRDGSRR